MVRIVRYDAQKYAYGSPAAAYATLCELNAYGAIAANTDYVAKFIHKNHRLRTSQSGATITD
jgi:hypothetical protein